MTTWKRSISAVPPTIARPRRTSASTMPQNSSAGRRGCGTRKYANSSRKTKRLSSERALDQVDGRVVHRGRAVLDEQDQRGHGEREHEPSRAPDRGLAERGV